MTAKAVPLGVPAVDGASRSRWGLLSDRGFRLLWSGQTISSAGSSVTAVALPLVAVEDLHAGPLAVGLLMAAVWLPWLVLGLPAGVWVGRIPRRTLMISCDAAMALVFVSVPIAAWAHMLTEAYLLVVAVVSGTGSVFFTSAYQVYLPELVGAGDLIEANAKLQGSASVAQVVGPGAGGLAAQVFGVVSGLVADAATFAISAVTLVLIRPRREAEADPHATSDSPQAGPDSVDAGQRSHSHSHSHSHSLRTEVADGFRFVVRDPYLRAITAFGAAANLALAAYQSIVVLYLVRDLHVRAGLVGPLVAVGALGGILGGWLVHPLCRRFGTARGAVAVQLAATPFAFLIPLASPGPGVALFVIGSLALVAGTVAGNVVFASFRQRYAPPEMVSRIITFAMTINHSSIPVGGLLGGGLSAVIGLRATLWATAGVLVASCAILLIGPLARRRDLPTAARSASHRSRGHHVTTWEA
ncbi:MFS transporter [Catenulispora sp. NF23]|uniref:MFS transporter n=1 Tax=Catenulispora pinistramenti TaxID=2705254 RepID=UPI001BA594CB|nr:MFS transporter [Catenulispora pinistramenti]